MGATVQGWNDEHAHVARLFQPFCSTKTSAVLFFSVRTGHWILNVFPQCEGDLTKLSTAVFPVFLTPGLDSNASGDSFMGCACVSVD
jgi:hypothetical protein